MKTNKIKLTILGAVTPLIMVSGFFAVAAHAATLALSPSPCDVVNTPFLTITQNITNDPDSGNQGDWATDAFTENVKVWMGTDGTTYCANANTMNGTFVTTGPLSPEHGISLPAGITGTFTGGENYTIPASTALNPDYSTTSTQATTLPDSSTAGFSWWVNNVFPNVATSSGSSFVKTYSLTYVATNGSTWTDADPVSGGDTGDITPVFDSTSQTGYATLQAAIDAATSSDTIVLGTDATTTTQININKPITIDGGGHTLHANFAKASATDYTNNSAIGITSSDVTIKNIVLDGTSGGQTYPLQLHGINIYKSTGITLDTVTISNFGGSGVVVNGSTVTATNLNTNGNKWNAVNVDPGKGVTDPSAFTLNSGTLSENAQIWSDGANVTSTATVTVTAGGYNMYIDTNPVGTLWTNKPVANAATITKNGNSTIYSSIQAAIDAAASGDTIVLVADAITKTQVNVNKAITLDGAGHTLNATFTKVDNSNNSAIGITHSDVTIKNLIEDGTGSTNLHGINIYESTGVDLNDVTVSNNGHSGVNVDGSVVTVNNITTANNGWDGIDVDQGPSVMVATSTYPATLTVNGVSSHSEVSPPIQKDDNAKTYVSVIDTNNQYNSSTYTHDTDVIGTKYALKNTVVNTEAELQTALSNPLVSAITANAGNYVGNITISNPVELLGPNATVNPNTGTRVAEAVITGQITDYASSTDIKGFTITNPNYGGSTIKGVYIYSAGPVISNINVENNIFSNIANSQAHGSYAVMVQGVVSGVSVSDNKVSGITSTGWAHGIEVTPTKNASAVPQSITVDGNYFTNISSSEATPDAYAFSNDWDSDTSNYADASQVTFRDNSLLGVKVRNLAATSTLDASDNWWGTASETEIAAKVLGAGTINFTPWYIDPGMKILSDAVGNATGTMTITAPAIDFAETADGAVTLPSGTSNLALGDNSVLDFSANANTASGGNIVIAGVTTTLASFTSGDLSGKDLSVPQTIGGQSITIDKAVKLSSGSASTPIVLTNSAVSNASVAIPDGTTILAPSGWTGTIAPPKAGSSSGDAPSGFSIGGTVISVGAPDVVLIFDKPVTLALAGVSGEVGYKSAGSSTWTTIDATCTGTYANPTGAVFPNECKITNGTDTKILTYHFTTFGSLVPVQAPTPAPVSNGGGGGGGGSYVNPYTITINTGAAQTASANVTLALTSLSGMNFMWISNDSSFSTSTGTGWIPFQATYPWTLTSEMGDKTVYVSFGSANTAVPASNAVASIKLVSGQVLGANASTNANANAATQGQVLGASAFRFTAVLQIGSRGDDVTELQNRLTAEGVYAGPITGYFGQLTEAAVKAYQQKNGIASVGVVGPQTRAKLNSSLASAAPASGQVLGASTSAETEALKAKLADLQAQLVVLLQKLAEMLQAQQK